MNNGPNKKKSINVLKVDVNALSTQKRYLGGDNFMQRKEDFEALGNDINAALKADANIFTGPCASIGKSTDKNLFFDETEEAKEKTKIFYENFLDPEKQQTQAFRDFLYKKNYKQRRTCISVLPISYQEGGVTKNTVLVAISGCPDKAAYETLNKQFESYNNQADTTVPFKLCSGVTESYFYTKQILSPNLNFDKSCAEEHYMYDLAKYAAIYDDLKVLGCLNTMVVPSDIENSTRINNIKNVKKNNAGSVEKHSNIPSGTKPFVGEKDNTFKCIPVVACACCCGKKETAFSIVAFFYLKKENTLSPSHNFDKKRDLIVRSQASIKKRKMLDELIEAAKTPYLKFLEDESVIENIKDTDKIRFYFYAKSESLHCICLLPLGKGLHFKLSPEELKSFGFDSAPTRKDFFRKINNGKNKKKNDSAEKTKLKEILTTKIKESFEMLYPFPEFENQIRLASNMGKNVTNDNRQHGINDISVQEKSLDPEIEKSYGQKLCLRA